MNQFIFAAISLGALSGISVLSPRVGLMLTLAYLAVIGDVRRLLQQAGGDAASDPMLLVAPLVALLLVILAVGGKRLRPNSSVGRLILWLMLIMTLEVFNPLQGGLSVGIAGALFYIVPLFWFWIGQGWGGTKTASVVLAYVVVPISILAAIMGMYQTFAGFLRYQKLWIAQHGYDSLIVGGRVRPFSFFNSSAEYTHYLAIGIMGILWLVFSKRHLVVLVFLPLLCVAIFLESGRGIIITLLFACAAVWAVQGKGKATWVWRLGLALTLGIGGMAVFLTQAQELDLPPEIAGLVQHQVNGLLDPTRSTAGTHLNMIWLGMSDGFTKPWGLGLGATTLASAKYGGLGWNTELDISNVFVSLGFVGGVLYVFLVWTIVKDGVLFWRKTKNYATIGILSLLFVELGVWLIGAHYSVCALLWFLIGCMDRPIQSVRVSQTQRQLVVRNENRYRHPTANPQ